MAGNPVHRGHLPPLPADPLPASAAPGSPLLSSNTSSDSARPPSTRAVSRGAGSGGARMAGGSAWPRSGPRPAFPATARPPSLRLQPAARSPGPGCSARPRAALGREESGIGPAPGQPRERGRTPSARTPSSRSPRPVRRCSHFPKPSLAAHSGLGPFPPRANLKDGFNIYLLVAELRASGRKARRQASAPPKPARPPPRHHTLPPNE